MEPRPSRNAAAGGFAIATGVLGGTILGAAVFHQPTVGFLVGTAAGIAVAVAVWLVDRR